MAYETTHSGRLGGGQDDVKVACGSTHPARLGEGQEDVRVVCESSHPARLGGGQEHQLPCVMRRGRRDGAPVNWAHAVCRRVKAPRIYSGSSRMQSAHAQSLSWHQMRIVHAFCKSHSTRSSGVTHAALGMTERISSQLTQTTRLPEAMPISTGTYIAISHLSNLNPHLRLETSGASCRCGCARASRRRRGRGVT